MPDNNLGKSYKDDVDIDAYLDLLDSQINNKRKEPIG